MIIIAIPSLDDKPCQFRPKLPLVSPQLPLPPTQDTVDPLRTHAHPPPPAEPTTRPYVEACVVL